MPKFRDPDDFHAYYVSLPLRVRGFVTVGEDGYPSVYINCRLSYEMQKRTLDHELSHLAHGDFYNDDSIWTAEGRAS